MFVAGKLAMISFNPTFYQERSYESPAEFRRHQNLEEYARSSKALEAAKTNKDFDDEIRIKYDLSDIQLSISDLRAILKQELKEKKNVS